MTAVVTDTLTVPARIGQDTFSPTVQLAYEPNDPYAVWLLFTEEDGPEHAFARELLAEGARGYASPLGGKVQVWAGEDVVYVQVDSDDGRIVVHLPKPAVLAFLLATYRVVPRGREHRQIDWVRETRELLREDA